MSGEININNLIAKADGYPVDNKTDNKPREFKLEVNLVWTRNLNVSVCEMITSRDAKAVINMTASNINKYFGNLKEEDFMSINVASQEKYKAQIAGYRTGKKLNDTELKVDLVKLLTAGHKEKIIEGLNKYKADKQTAGKEDASKSLKEVRQNFIRGKE
ncbi:MAG: hypothetical protein ABIH00_06620 [Armatimonadota bacterium]